MNKWSIDRLARILLSENTRKSEIPLRHQVISVRPEGRIVPDMLAVLASTLPVILSSALTAPNIQITCDRSWAQSEVASVTRPNRTKVTKLLLTDCSRTVVVFGLEQD